MLFYSIGLCCLLGFASLNAIVAAEHGQEHIHLGGSGITNGAHETKGSYKRNITLNVCLPVAPVSQSAISPYRLLHNLACPAASTHLDAI